MKTSRRNVSITPRKIVSKMIGQGSPESSQQNKGKINKTYLANPKIHKNKIFQPEPSSKARLQPIASSMRRQAATDTSTAKTMQARRVLGTLMLQSIRSRQWCSTASRPACRSSKPGLRTTSTARSRTTGKRSQRRI